MKKISILLALLIALCGIWPAFAEQTGADGADNGQTAPGGEMSGAEAVVTPGEAEPEPGAATVGNIAPVVIERKKTVSVAVPVTFRSGEIGRAHV